MGAESKKEKRASPLQHLLAGGAAGFVESSICHPLDTVKTRMQLTGMSDGALSSGISPRDVASRGTAAVVVGVGGATSSSSSSSSSSVPGASSTFDAVGWRQRVAPPSAASATAKAAYTTATSPNIARASIVGAAAPSSLGPLGTARRIIRRQGPTALYRGLTAVYTGIIPKMAIRFVSFEYYKDALGAWRRADGISATAATATPSTSQSATFLAGLLSGLTEAVVVVTPAEVCKIRMQSQCRSLAVKYENVVQTAVLIVREEGLGALYKGVVPTMLRQGCNQAVNFTAYDWGKGRALECKRSRAEGGGGDIVAVDVRLDQWQTLLLGGLSGGMGPLANNPLDVVKTRMQRQVVHPGMEPKYNGLLGSCVVIAREEGTRALWKGITPRLMRIMPGQAITFTTYEAVTERIERYGLLD